MHTKAAAVISETLNDQADLGTVGSPRSAGDDAAAIRAGMVVIDTDGREIGVVEAVEGQILRLAGGTSDARHLPLSLVDGVDDRRVILSARGDNSFGLGATP